MQENDLLYDLLPKRVKTANIVLLKILSVGMLTVGFSCIIAVAAIGNPVGNRNKSIASLSLSVSSLISGFVALACSKACDEADRYHDYLEQQEQRAILRRFGASEQLDRVTLQAYLDARQSALSSSATPPFVEQGNAHSIPKPQKARPESEPETALSTSQDSSFPLPISQAPALEPVSQPEPPESPQVSDLMPGFSPRLTDVLSAKLEKVRATADDSPKQETEKPLSEDEIITKALEQKRFDSVEELVSLLESPRYYWLRIVCLSRLLMIIGDQGSGKTSFSKFVCAVRQLLWQHTVAIHDPHAEKNGWPENWTIKGHHKNYGEIDQGIDHYFDAVDTTNGSGQRLTFLFDEVTQYKDSLPDGDKSQKFVKSWCSDVRKSDLCLIALTHSDTNEGLAGTKGMKASIDSSFLKLFLGNQIDPETGDFVPNFKGVLVGLSRDEFNRPQQTTIKLEQWMRSCFITDLLFNKVSPTLTTPAVVDADALSQQELNIQSWQAIKFPEQIDLLPKNVEGFFAICIDGYNPLYIGLVSWLITAHFERKSESFYTKLQSLIQEGHQPYIAFNLPQNQNIEYLKGVLSQLIFYYSPVWNNPTKKVVDTFDKQPLKLTEQQQAVIDFAIKNKGEISTRQAMRDLGGKLKCKSAEEALLLFQFLEKIGLGKIYEEPTKSGSSIRFCLTSSSSP
jgi:hypothetical protein